MVPGDQVMEARSWGAWLSEMEGAVILSATRESTGGNSGTNQSRRQLAQSGGSMSFKYHH